MALTTRLPSSKVEPFYGFVETTGDALRLIQAARQGVIPRITRRLNDLERRAMIRSGSIFIFSDDESGIKRWTEGLSWSASRIVGNFLVYREVNERGQGRSMHEGRKPPKRRSNSSELSAEELAEQKLSKTLVGCLNDNHGRFKSKGLIKKTITVCVEGSDHHLIAYYNQEDVRLGKLLPLSSRADIMSLEIPSELLEMTKFRVPPVTEPGLDGRPRYICDADETENIRLPYPPSPASSIPPATPTRCPSISTLMPSGFIGQQFPDSPSRQGSSAAFSGFQTPLHDGQLFSPVDMSGQPFDSTTGLRWLSPSSAISRMSNFSRSSSSSSLSSLGEGALNGLTPTAMMQMGCLDMFGEAPAYDGSGLSNFLSWSNGDESAVDASCGSLGPAFTLSNTSPVSVSDDFSPTSNVFAWPPMTSPSDITPPPSAHSSLPSTPTHPRQNQQRFSSLPSGPGLDISWM